MNKYRDDLIKENKKQLSEKQTQIEKDKIKDNNANVINKKRGTKGKKQKNPLKIPKTVQDSIPYECIYANGIIETTPGFFSKSYYLNDGNFKVATDDEQDKMFKNYQTLLNSFGSDVNAEVTINNKNIDKDDLLNDILLKPKDDGKNDLREEYNNMLLDKLSEGRNNLKNEKYLTLTIQARDINKADAEFQRLDSEVAKNVKKIIDIPATPISMEKRLEILYDIYNLGHEGTFLSKLKMGNQTAKLFDFNKLAPMGLSTKDIIGPETLVFNKDYFECGDKYARVLYLHGLPNLLSTDFIADVTEIPCNMLTSIHYTPIDPGAARKLVSRQITNIREDVIKAQKRAAQSGYNMNMISPALQKAEADAEDLYEQVNQNNQKLFLMTMCITHFADTLEQLNSDTQNIISEGNKHVCVFRNLLYQQELGFASSLPIGVNKLTVDRLLTTEGSAIFIPFTSMELADKNGFYYGINAVSKNLLMFNRLNSKNGNGVILGAPGSGKSFASKREIVNILLNTDDQVIIIDPEREYVALNKEFDGETVRVAVGSRVYINPLDVDLDEGSDHDDPITLKSDFMCSLVETMMGGHMLLGPSHKSIIDRCVRRIYNPYIEHINMLNREKSADEPKITCVPEAAPTLQDFYQLLIAQPEPEAQSIALALELYCQGSFDLFAHHTNVETHNRFVVYDTKDLGSTMIDLGLQVCLNDIWNKMISNHKKGIKTWIYIDEFHHLVKTQTSSNFVMNIWKRARKWSGIPTGMTQNVGDLLGTPAAQAVILNSEFIMMLGQSAFDRDVLGEMLKISPSQLSYITNSDPGEGLIYTGKTIVPFIDKFPKGKLYNAMTTKVGERADV